jgi:hypothetical protein
MRVTDAWLAYIVVTLVVYVLLSFCNCRLQWSQTVKLLVAFLAGLLVVLFLIPSINPTSDMERTWYSLLLIVGFLIPLGLAIWTAWSNRMIPGLNDGVEEVYQCDEDKCELISSTATRDGKIKRFEYRSPLAGSPRASPRVPGPRSRGRTA